MHEDSAQFIATGEAGIVLGGAFPFQRDSTLSNTICGRFSAPSSVYTRCARDFESHTTALDGLFIWLQDSFAGHSIV